ncbi:MAG TPA: choice-of-anchor D domain-containing protein [Acidobacteriaceae bacterium]|nr:choice-of-anchor D domain-containing protein [Acidobacteriaceae bacterium]
MAALFLACLCPAPAHSQAHSQPAQQRRVEDFLAQRRTADGSNSALARARAQAQHASLLSRNAVRAHAGSSSPLTAAWQPLGPSSVFTQRFGNVTGRVTSIAFDPNDSTRNTVYLGTTGGGVWKSTNAAGPLASITFAPLTDTLPVFSISAGSTTIPSLSIGAVAVQPAPNPVVLAGTGDPNDATDSLYGEGILRSADGGQTWTIATLAAEGTSLNQTFAGLSTAGLAWSSASTNVVVAAMSVSPQAAIVDAQGSASVPGLYYSTDAGASWKMATLYDGAVIVQSPQPVGSGQVGNAATSVVWDAVRGLFIAAVRSHGYYSSPDGKTWTRLTNQPGTGLTTTNCPVGANGVGSSTCPIFRGTLAVQPATGDLYALTVDVNDNDQGLWQDLCAASGGSCTNPSPTWGARIDNGALEVGSGSTAIIQGGYDLTLAVAPNSAGGTLLFAGTVDLYRCAIASGATSCTLRNTTNALNGCNAPAAIAPAQHAIAAALTGAGTQLVLVGNDGGLWRSTDGVNQTGPACSVSDAQHFDNLNAAIGSGGSLAEVISFAQDPANPDILIAGLGANGTAATTSASTLASWPQLSAGEGGFSAIDPNTPSNWFVTIGAGVNLAACTSGLNCTAADLLSPAAIGAPQVNNDQSLLDAPSLLDPQLTTNVLVGTCRVWRGPAASGGTWSTANQLSRGFDGTTGACSANSAMVRSLAAGGPVANSTNAQSAGATVLYAGMAGQFDQGQGLAGHLFVTKSANTDSSSTAWADVALSPVTNSDPFNSGAFDISSIAVDPHDATGATVYATVMGFGIDPHLYRSTDFGAHWTAISFNLPPAPANAVVVDPNDPNTVYVALDTGVFVTQAVTTCASANCWSPLGTGLPNAPVTTLEAAPNMPTGDGRLGMLRAGTYGRGLWQIPLLGATTTTAPAITLSATTLNFGAQPVSTQSSPQTITVTSSGNAPVTFSEEDVTGDFVEHDTCIGQTLAVGASCTFSISFAPTQTGSRTGNLLIDANIPGGQATVSLNGIATAPASIVLTPAALTFPATIVNQTAAAQIITVANTGANPATLNSPSITGDFSIAASTCTATLAAQTACSISISFTPTASGTRAGVLTITDSVGTQTAQLSGTGNAPATDTLAPLSLTFAQQAIGTNSAVQQVTLTNSGDVALTLITASVTAGDFTATNSCGASLNPHSACAVLVAFVPTAVGTRSATLTITDQFRSQTVTLTGTGVAPAGVSLSPTALGFPATGVGLSAPPQTLTLTNNGGLPLHIANMVLSAGFTLASSSCDATLSPAASCNLIIVFSPTTAGAIAGTLTLTDDAPSGTQTTNVTGTGVDFSLASNGATSVTVVSGATATYPLLLTSLNGLSGSVALACSGAPANSICTVNPATANLGGTSTLSVTVQTGQTTAELRQPRSPFAPRNSGPVLAFFALPLAFALRRRQLPRLLLAAIAVIALTSLTGCGSERLIPNQGGPGGSSTPTGSYNLTVSASAAGLTHSVNLTLTVQ